MNACTAFRPVGLALALGIPLLLAPSLCRADLLPVPFLPGAPSISGSNGTVAYNASTGDFNAMLTGSSLDYAAPFVNPPRGFALFSGSLSLDLTVDHGGNFVANGTGLVLTGTISFRLADGGSVTFAGPTLANPLLAGSITAFGAQSAGPPSLSFDGYYTVNTGALTQTMLDSKGIPVSGGFSSGATGGFLLSAENVTRGTLGDFSSSFSSSNVKPTVGVLIPEPSAPIAHATPVLSY